MSGKAAYELINMSTCRVHLMSFDNDFSDVSSEEYHHWNLKFPWMINPGGVRHTTMSSSCLFASPGMLGVEDKPLDIKEPWEPKTW